MNESIGAVSDEKAPTSTSKALMLSLSVPRIYRVYIPPKDQPEASEEARQKTLLAQQAKESEERESGQTHSIDASTNESSSTDTPPLKDGTVQSALAKVATLVMGDGLLQQQQQPPVDDIRVVQIHNERNASETILEHEVGYVEADEENGRRASLVEHVVTKEEMDMIVKLDPSEEEALSTAPVSEDENTKPIANTESPNNSARYESATGVLGVINSKIQEIARAHLSRDEAVAAIKQYEQVTSLVDPTGASLEKQPDSNQDEDSKVKPNTEIKLGELLRLTVRALYMENHFYNAPIYTDVQARIMPQSPDLDDWLEVSVMVKPSSIGIILERLERIGVGSTVGTIAIFRAELLRTCDVLYDNVLQDDTMPKMVMDPKAGNDATDSEAAQREAKLEAARAEWKNAACRLRVEQVKEQIEEQAELALDYLVLLSVASVLAGIGLVTDNAVVIVASMLVSRKYIPSELFCDVMSQVLMSILFMLQHSPHGTCHGNGFWKSCCRLELNLAKFMA